MKSEGRISVVFGGERREMWKEGGKCGKRWGKVEERWKRGGKAVGKGGKVKGGETVGKSWVSS